jgi:hypothetical protein
MNVTDPRTRSLLRQAGRVADAGKRAAAEKLYRELIEEAPEVADAWLGLAETVRDPAEKEAAYERALALEPANERAILGLERLRNPLPPAEPDPPATVEEPAAQVTTAAESEKAESVVLVPPPPVPVAETDELIYCANHPDRETNLRCNRCGKPICSRCARRTPVGYRCRECVREQEEAFFTATAVHYALAVLIALPLSLLAGFFAPRLGWWVIFIAAAAGTIIGRIVFRLIGRRRGRWLPHLVAAVVALGAAASLLPILLILVVAPEAGLGSLALSLIWPVVYAAIAAPSAYYQMK